MDKNFLGTALTGGNFDPSPGVFAEIKTTTTKVKHDWIWFKHFVSFENISCDITENHMMQWTFSNTSSRQGSFQVSESLRSYIALLFAPKIEFRTHCIWSPLCTSSIICCLFGKTLKALTEVLHKAMFCCRLKPNTVGESSSGKGCVKQNRNYLNNIEA